jgi:orotate phosphoribosyltransferase
MDYEGACYDGENLRAIGRAFAKWIPDDCDVVASTGSSGCAIATATIMSYRQRKLTHLYVRKPRELRHGGDTTIKKHDIGWRYKGNKNAVIVDDFIESGASVLRVYHKLLSLGFTVQRVIVGESFGSCMSLYEKGLSASVDIVMLQRRDYKPRKSDMSKIKGWTTGW